ncbi:phospholipase D-like protein [Murinocardiopsis flavida]|uniref:Phospholipase D-like protein n=1 Tax=Murinocardiopsis flavida TaxID=645275 RepID=A0A2P8DP79_9ACTN|nr:AAA domain-containing protein [Murinocardiopsis flavida]PSK99016.1 phospholipase D-like protein [Murinocardiopsis flavida]
MQPSSRPQWLADVIAAVRTWHKAEGGGAADKSRADVDLGRVLTESTRGPGWFLWSARDSPPDETALEEAYLAPASGSKDIRYRLRETINDEGRLLIRVATDAPREGLHLWKRGRPTAHLVQTLLDGLERLTGDGPAAAFGAGRADPLRSELAGPVAGLNPGQRLAYSACVSPGLQLVWGPPGTGKTEVIIRALLSAIKTGKSVLLVSGTNVAVDNALDRAIRSLRPAAGTVIRVGTPHLASVADNPNVSLTTLKRRRQEAKEKEVLDLEQRVVQARVPVETLAKAQERLARFDPATDRAARARIASADRAARIAAEVAAAQERLNAKGAELEIGRQVAAEVEEEWASVSLAAERWSRIDRSHRELAELGQRRDRSALAVSDGRSAVRAAEEERDRHTATGMFSRLRDRQQRRTAEQGVVDAQHRLAAAEAEHAALLPVLAREEGRVNALIAELERQNHGTPRYFVQNVSRRLAEARRTVRDGSTAYDRAVGDHRRFEANLAEARARSMPTDHDRKLVAWADRNGLLRLHQGLDALSKAAEQALSEVKRLTTARQKAEQELAELGRDAERYFVGRATVVATTLAMMRMKPVIGSRTYDLVIVDECAAAGIPEVLLAAGRATSGVTLLGDFMQNMPIEAASLRRNSDPHVKRWLAPRDCFAALDVTRPEEAEAAPGCVVLTEQHRFGPELTRLVNAASYGGLLTSAAGAAATDICFVDVDGLGDSLAGVHPSPDGAKGKWWSVGGVISRAIAEQQLATKEARSVGIVAPYKVQAGLTKAIIDDAGGNPLIDIGTSHRFQGREFDTVVFDMVEDGNGWVAAGEFGSNGFKLAGLKLSNVAMTRARRRLYLIGNGAAVERARSGVLSHIRAGIGRGDIRVVPVRDILHSPAPSALEGPAADLWDAVSQYVKYTGLYDEGDLPDELVSRIEGARRSVWLWAPWTGARLHEFLPALEAAQARGVHVQVTTLPTWDEMYRGPSPKAQRMRDCHEDLTTRVRKVVYMENMHQKIAVIDEEVVFIGSMNVLSHRRDGGRREIMTVVESAAYARHILDFERVDQLSRPPRCPKCNERIRTFAFKKPSKAPALYWLCRSAPPSTPGRTPRVCSEQAFPPLSRGRNQQRGSR